MESMDKEMVIGIAAVEQMETQMETLIVDSEILVGAAITEGQDGIMLVS